MSAATKPRLSVVLATDRSSTIGETLDALRRQTVAEQLELVIVAPPTAEIDLADGGAGFGAVTVAVCDGIESAEWLPRARALGVRRASAPVVAIGETHSFPEPSWAEALLAAHEGPYAAVGVRMRNANPRSRISWANLFIDFGPWVERAERGTMDELPGHNTSYKRDILLARGDRLETDFASETLLAADLRAAGHELLYEPAAATRHLNLATPYWFLQRLDHDREWAVQRASGWSAARRMLYVLGAPLIPLVRFARIYPQIRRAGRGHDPLLAAAVLCGLVAGAAGEAAAYLWRSSGSSARRLHDGELHRAKYAGTTDR